MQDSIRTLQDENKQLHSKILDLEQRMGFLDEKIHSLHGLATPTHAYAPKGHPKIREDKDPWISDD